MNLVLLKETPYYSLFHNTEYDQHDSEDANYILQNKETKAIEYKSLVFPMAFEALLTLSSHIDEIQSKLDQYLSAKEKHKKVLEFANAKKTLN